MKKAFLSYPFTGENLETLHVILSGIVGKLRELGYEAFCALIQKAEIDDLGIIGYDNRLAYCLSRQKQAEVVIAVILSENPSNGMIQELKQAKDLGQEYLLFIKEGLDFKEFRDYANQVVEYSKVSDLPDYIGQVLSSTSTNTSFFELSE